MRIEFNYSFDARENSMPLTLSVVSTLGPASRVLPLSVGATLNG